MANIKLLYGLSADLPTAKVDGRLLFATDTGEIYFDINDTRIKLYQNPIADAKKAGTDAATAVTTLEGKVGTPDTGKTIVQMIKALETQVTGGGDGSETKTLSQRVAEAEAAITTLNASETTAGSVKKTVADAIAAIVAGADTDFDTLKEIADWIKNDTTGAAQMANDISAIKTALGVTGTGTEEDPIVIPDVADTVADAINALDVSDTEVEGKYVSGVAQADGKITVTRKDLPTLEWGTFADAASI